MKIKLKKKKKQNWKKEKKNFNRKYEKFITNKLKQKRYESIMDDTYHLLDNSRTEYQLCIDILKERIKCIEQYYKKVIFFISILWKKAILTCYDSYSFLNLIILFT